MPDIATPNLPSRGFDATEAFYSKLGFERGYRDEGWMILHRGPKGNRAILEFFPHSSLDPKESWFSACIRLDDLEEFMSMPGSIELSRDEKDIPRIKPASKESSGLKIAYLVDIDGSLIRLIQNEA